MDASTIQQIADAYTQGVHVDVICDDFDITRERFMQLRREHTFRRGRPCLVDFDVTSDDEVLDAIEHLSTVERKALVEKRARRKAQRELKRDARKWREHEAALEDAHAAFEARWEDYQVPALTPSLDEDSGALILNLQDLHIGKLPHDGRGDLDSYLAQLRSALKKVLRRTRKKGRIETIYLILGGDFLHVDNDQGSTTRGTPQDLLTTPQGVLTVGQQFAVEMIDLCRAATSGDVDVIYVPGNHDRLLSLSVYTFCKAWYRGCPEVLFDDSYAPRQYRVYGRLLIAATHGDMSRTQTKKLPQIVSQEARPYFGDTDWTIIVSGHLHTEVAQDLVGTLLYQCPSPSVLDRWHELKGYVGNYKAIQGIWLDGDTRDTDVTTVGA